MFIRAPRINPHSLAFKVATVSLLLSGCSFSNRKEEISKGDAQMPGLSHKAKSFDSILSFCEKHFHVRDSKKRGKSTVIIFSDIHNQKIELKNIEQLKKLHTGVQLDAFGFEGYFVQDAPAVYHKIKEILSLHPEKVFNGSNAASLETQERLYMSLSETTFKGIPQIFLENEKMFINAEIAQIWRVNLKGLLQTIEGGNAPAVCVNAKNIQAFQDILNCQEYLRSEDASFPQVSLSMFASKQAPEGDVVYGDKTAVRFLKERLKQYERWYAQHVIEERNKIASAAVINFHTQNKNACSAVVFGADHTHSYAQTISLQRYLARSNISYIVIDPYPWTEMSSIWPSETRGWKD